MLPHVIMHFPDVELNANFVWQEQIDVEPDTSPLE
jgi:hypothetical protein